jgi:hypothetical protein
MLAARAVETTGRNADDTAVPARNSRRCIAIIYLVFFRKTQESSFSGEKEAKRLLVLALRPDTRLKP